MIKVPDKSTVTISERLCNCWYEVVLPIITLSTMCVVTVGTHEVFSPSGRLPDLPRVTVEVIKS